MVNIKFIIGLFLSFMLAACGGGGSSSPDSTPVTMVEPEPATFTGIFLDSAVEGLNYATSTTNGITNATGEFTYQTNENITFSLGDIEFPTILAKSVITPLDIIGTNDINNISVINVLRLLQSLDVDGEPANGIQIMSSVHDRAKGLTVDFSANDFDQSVIELLMSNYNDGGYYQELISAESAVYHFQQTLNDINGSEQGLCTKTHSMIGYYGYFETLAHGVSGRAEIIDDCTIKITEFYYDGKGPDVYFYAAKDHQYGDENAFAISNAINGPAYENAEFMLTLPNDKTMDDLNGLSVWCIDFNANFGQVEFTP